MGKKLAIRGHATRGKEVIELLEMMGGVNWMGSLGNTVNRIYYISESKSISFDDISLKLIDEYEIFTLEEFLEKYPFKIGDVIRFFNDIVEEIAEMEWNEDSEDILCTSVSGCKRFLRAHLENPKNNKQKETMLADNLSSKWVNEFECPDGYIFKDENGNVINTTKITLEKKKKEYPKTYEECCRIMRVELWNTLWGENATKYEKQTEDLIDALIRLKVCRDAYWKIAGDEMGLGKLWKPDWNHINRKFYCICNSKNNIVKNVLYSKNIILAFPTEEMRDAFYENFKDLIEQCKELL